MKAFLSHSSKDKANFVSIVAKSLAREHIVYDEFTFESGSKTMDEIVKGLTNSDLFVFFISENSLSSPWVKNEWSNFKKIMDSDRSRLIFPVLIDNKIIHNDSRIPDWMKENYNLRLVTKPSVVARRIHQKLREIWHSKGSDTARMSKIFIGRHDLFKSFENRWNDFDNSKPIVVVVSGLNSVGRRSFVKEAFSKVRVIKNTFPVMYLDSDSYIEDFILKLNDFGVVSIDSDLLSGLSNKEICEKNEIVHKMMDGIKNDNEVVIIVDNGCLVNYKGEISEWFLDIVKSYKGKDAPIFSIVSRKRVDFKKRHKADSFYFLDLPELNISERKSLLKSCFEIVNCDISQSDMLDVFEVLSGMPNHIKFAVNEIKNRGHLSVAEIIPIVADYNTEDASTMLKNYNEQEIEVVRLLAQFDIISSDFLFSIIDASLYYNVIENLVYDNIIDLIDVDFGLLRLSDSIRNYVRRNKLNINEAFKEKIKENVRAVLSSNDVFSINSSDYLYALQEALKDGQVLDDKLLIPSHYIRTIKDIYFNKENMDRVIQLSDVVLQNSSKMSALAVKDVRYYLCLALAKTKNRRFLNEVQNIHGPEHDFLMGYYYRLVGKYNDALIRFKGIVNEPYVSSRVKREIVQVYVFMEEFEKALFYAKNNYEENKGNQFHIQAYFNCLINSSGAIDFVDVLNELIAALEAIKSNQALEMSGICKAIYFAKIDNDNVKAFAKIEETIESFPNSFYPMLTFCDLCIRYNDLDKLNQGFSILEKMNKSISTRTLNKYKAYILAFEGRFDSAIQLIREDLEKYPEDSRSKIEDNLRSIAARNGSKD